MQLFDGGTYKICNVEKTIEEKEFSCHLNQKSNSVGVFCALCAIIVCQTM